MACAQRFRFHRHAPRRSLCVAASSAPLSCICTRRFSQCLESAVIRVIDTTAVQQRRLNYIKLSSKSASRTSCSSCNAHPSAARKINGPITAVFNLDSQPCPRDTRHLDHNHAGGPTKPCRVKLPERDSRNTPSVALSKPTHQTKIIGHTIKHTAAFPLVHYTSRNRVTCLTMVASAGRYLGSVSPEVLVRLLDLLGGGVFPSLMLMGHFRGMCVCVSSVSLL